MKFPKSTYMYWQQRFERENPDQKLEDAIWELREKHEDYGYRRIHAALKNNGWHVNKKKVQRLVQKLSLQVTSFGRKSRKYNSYKGHVGKVAPNRIKRRFHSSVPHQKITTDTTEFKYYIMGESGAMQIRKAYLDPFMDLYNMEILCYSLTETPSGETIMDTLKEAVQRTNDCKFRRTFHSDQGWAYQMNAYVKELKTNRIFQSMSRKGNCLDNAQMENFFGIMKQEMYYGKVFHSFEELKTAIDSYIRYYNEERIKERLGWRSPVQYRLLDTA